MSVCVSLYTSVGRVTRPQRVLRYARLTQHLERLMVNITHIHTHDALATATHCRQTPNVFSPTYIGAQHTQHHTICMQTLVQMLWKHRNHVVVRLAKISHSRARRRQSANYTNAPTHDLCSIYLDWKVGAHVCGRPPVFACEWPTTG